MTRLVARVERDILILQMESPDGLPRLGRSVMAEIDRLMTRLGAETELRGCLIAGGEKAFAVGAAIEEVAGLKGAEALEFSRRGQSLMDAIANSRKPVIAAIRGFCLGGGLDLALACHKRMATADAAFGHPGGAIGIFTGWGGTQRLSRLIGRARANEMLVTGRRISAREAREWGLVDELIGEREILAAAMERLRGIGGAIV
jgi:enoyl-CoA hydratase